MKNQKFITNELLAIAQEQHEEKLITNLATVKAFGEMKMQLTEASEPVTFGETLRNATKPGVYFIFYKPEKDEVARYKYIGTSGSVQGRVNQHVRFYKLGGKSSDPTKNAGAIKKMYDYDSDIENWGIFWVECPTKEYAEQYEDICIQAIQPEFNALHMGGV